MKTLLWITLLFCAWPAVSQEPADLAGERGRAAQQLSLAESHFLRGENPKALETYRKARELFFAAGDPLGQGHTWKGEADVLFRFGDDHEALDAYRHARELFRAAGDQLGQGDSWRGEARVLFRLGEDQKARAAHEAARQLFRAARPTLLAAGEQLRLGHTWYYEAEILYWLSENKDEKEPVSPTQALFCYRKARELYLAAGNTLGQGNTWRGEGDVHVRLGKHQKALDAYSKARKLFMTVGDYEGQGDTWLGEAEARQFVTDKPETEDFETNPEARPGKAKKAVATAIANYQNAGVVSKQITALLLKFEIEEAYEEGLRQLGGPPIPLINIGPIAVTVSPQIIHKFLNRLRPNTRLPEEAIRFNNNILRETGTTEDDRIQRDQKFVHKAYDTLVTLRARQKSKVAEALRLAEEARSRVLLDLLATPPNRGRMPSFADVTAERQRLETKMSQLEEKLRGFPPLEQQEELRVQRLQLELKWIAAGKKPFPQEPPLDTAAIQNLARETGPLLVYYVAESEVWGFLIRPETAEIYRRSIPISRDELEKMIGAFVDSLSNPVYGRGPEAQALRLWGLLIEPFIERLPESGSLVLVPHGPLHALPFEALRDAAGKRLFEHWRTSIVPSISALAFARSRHTAPSPGDSFLGFSSGRGLNLPVDEVEKISRFFGNRQAAAANYSNYEELVAAARHLLISTRGDQSDQNGTETYLEIEPTSGGHDSHLTATEIATIPLKAELVTLAACNTSHGRPLLSDERLDVTRSFLIAGAAAVLAARWKIPENTATSQFLKDFYQTYRRGVQEGTGMRKDEALAEARRLSRGRGDPALVWAAWVLIGDAR